MYWLSTNLKKQREVKSKMTIFMKKIDYIFLYWVLGILYCVGVSPNVVAAETAKKNISENTKISHYTIEIADVKILSSKKNGCKVDVELSVSYDGEDLGTTVQTTNHLIGGDGTVVFGFRDGKVIKKGKKQYKIQYSYAGGGAVNCSGIVKFITKVEDKNGNKSNSYTSEIDFK